MHEKQIIFESKYLIVIGLENLQQPNNSIIVTFNEVSFYPSGDRFWGEPLFAKLPYSAVGVVSKFPNWYPAADMREALPLMLAAIRGRPVITYGHSQGGYGALKYAAALNARATLAFCPQWSINPDDVGGFDQRFISFFKPALGNGRAVSTTDIRRNAFAFFDPYQRQDAQNIDKMHGFPELYPVICPFSGHETVRLITEAHTGAVFLETVHKHVQTGTSPLLIASELRRLLRSTRSSAPTYHKNRGATLMHNGKWHILTAMQKANASSVPDHIRLQLATQGRNPASVYYLLLTLPFEALKAYGVIAAWRQARAAQFRAAELRLAELIIANCSGEPFALLHAVNSLISHGMQPRAAELLASIVSAHGIKDVEQATHIRNFAATLKLPSLQRAAGEYLREQPMQAAQPPAQATCANVP